jgi:hypothetical protein
MKSPFEVVYNFEPPTALDLLPLPQHERTSTWTSPIMSSTWRNSMNKQERQSSNKCYIKLHGSTWTRKREYSKKVTPYGSIYARIGSPEKGEWPLKVLNHINNNSYISQHPVTWSATHWICWTFHHFMEMRMEMSWGWSFPKGRGGCS